MTELRNSSLLTAATLASDDKFIVINDTQGVAFNLKLSDLVAYIAPLIGTGTGGDPEVPPTLPPTADVFVPVGRPDGAIIAYVSPVVTGVPIATWSMTPLTGAAIRTDTGDIYLADSVAFFAALGAGTLTTTVTAANPAGSNSATVTLTAMPDYEDLPDAYAANLWFDWDLLDNRQIVYDGVTNQIVTLADKSPAGRNGHNSQDKPGYVLNSNMGAGKPAMRMTGATGQTSGLHYNENTLWRGLRLGLATSSTYDRVSIGVDQKYRTDVPDESGQNVMYIQTAKDGLIGKPVLITIIATTSLMTYRINGADAGTQVPDSYNQPHYPIIVFVLAYLNAATGTLISCGAVGQGEPWKDSALNGDLCRIVQYLNAVAA